MRSFVARYWRGDESVRRSLVIGLCVAGISLVLLLKLIAPLLVRNGLVALGPLTILLVVIALTVVTWQVVGFSRSWRKHYAGPGAGLDALCMRAAILCYGLVVAFSLLDMSRFTLDPSTAWTPSWFRPHTELVYEPLNDPRTIRVAGKIEFGLGRRLKALLDTHPDISRLELTSPGGVISEARGVGLLVRERTLNTYVSTQCFSACTLIFVSGKHRSIQAGAQLGFHQYAIQMIYTPPGVDLEQDQNRDAKLFVDQGIQADFMAKAYATPHDDMWIPALEQLVESGLVHAVVPKAPSKH